jgi:hypothetical protein
MPGNMIRVFVLMFYRHRRLDLIYGSVLTNDGFNYEMNLCSLVKQSVKWFIGDINLMFIDKHKTIETYFTYA